MSLSESFVRGGRDDPERIAAFAWLAESATRYPPGQFIPALERPGGDAREMRFSTLTFHAHYDDDARQHVVDTIGYFDGDEEVHDYPITGDDVAAFMVAYVLTRRNAGSLIVTNGGQHGIIDALVEAAGRSLVVAGYIIEPVGGNAGFAWARIKKGNHTWTVTSCETMTGLSLSKLAECAAVAVGEASARCSPAEALYSVIRAYRSFLSGTFGSALRPTIGMTAAASVRRFIPEGVYKWRPNPLLVAMNREGLGYRGGVTYARRYRGRTHRIDVNRQYTSMLALPLPRTVKFGRYPGHGTGAQGVYICTVRSPYDLAYPVGVWVGGREGFVRRTIKQGTFIAVLHSSEFDALTSWDCEIDAGQGYTYTETFSLSEYVDTIAEVCTRMGRQSPFGRATKPLGNMVYGKFGQRPDRWEYAYATERPDETWRPHFTADGHDMLDYWERQVWKYSLGMHVDIAGTITGYARSQTMQTWALLSALGYNVLRVHTDSITTDKDPRAVISCDDDMLGAWKYESNANDGIIGGVNAYADDDGGHVAGIPGATRAMLAELHATGEVLVTRNLQLPRQGWMRGRHDVERRLTGAIHAG